MFSNYEELIKSCAIPNADSTAKTLNDGALSGVECSICGNKGYTIRKDGISIFTSECVCMNRRRALLRARKSGFDETLNAYTFRSFQTPDDFTRRVKERAADYVKHGSGKWFYISGKPGSGKTHICTAICNALLNDGKSVKYVLWREIAQKLKAAINEQEYEVIMRSLKSPDILYIDDFLKGTVSDADENRAFEIINARYNMPSKRTIISSERDIKDIRAIDEATGGRIWQRSKGYCFKTPGINWRN